VFTAAPILNRERSSLQVLHLAGPTDNALTQCRWASFHLPGFAGNPPSFFGYLPPTLGVTLRPCPRVYQLGTTEFLKFGILGEAAELCLRPSG
jgi:hypothetical protein